ncbi:MAG: cytochrome c oxidase subunit 4 [Beutenbergiaceae bacterium]
MAGRRPKKITPLKPESVIMVVLAVFFGVMGTIYSLWTYSYYGQIEPIGAVTLYLLVGMFGLAGGYLIKLAREIPLRPEDEPNAEVDEGAGEYGEFSPWSWWPLVLGLAVSLVFLGPALHAWWLSGIGAAIGVIGLVGHVLEYNRGPHAH